MAVLIATRLGRVGPGQPEDETGEPEDETGGSESEKNEPAADRTP